MKTLIKNYSPSYCSKVVRHTMDGKDERFKIVAECGNCYSKLSISIQTLNKDFSVIATKEDIPSYIHVNYVWGECIKLKNLKDNIKAAEDYIKKVF